MILELTDATKPKKMCNEDSSPIITLKAITTAHTGTETDTFHVSGHFLLHLQQKNRTERRLHF